MSDDITDLSGVLTLRLSRGEHRPTAKLSDVKVSEIRKLRNDGVSQRALARMFDVSQGTIWKIINHFAWKHIK
jgi:DNA invertase Pin-like site-specific DNA recombinase